MFHVIRPTNFQLKKATHCRPTIYTSYITKQHSKVGLQQSTVDT